MAFVNGVLTQNFGEIQNSIFLVELFLKEAFVYIGHIVYIFFTREIYVYKCKQPERGQFNHYLMLNKSLKYFVASVHNQKIPRINFQTKVTNVPWTFSNGLPQGTLFKQAPLS